MRLVLNRRLKQYAGWYISWKSQIDVKRPNPSVKTILHEFAHHLDAKRTVDYDGKGHGGSYTAAMLEVVEHHFDVGLKIALMRAYENVGAIVGASESRKVADRTSAGQLRREERHGIVEEAWAIKLGSGMWLGQDGDSVWLSLDKAGVWKREATAQKKGLGTVVKVEAQLDTLYSNRWWALREVE